MIDLASDTKTEPTLSIPEAIVRADFRDEQYRKSPIVNALFLRIPDLTSQAAVVFLLSGATCTEIAQIVSCQPATKSCASIRSIFFSPRRASRGHSPPFCGPGQ